MWKIIYFVFVCESGRQRGKDIETKRQRDRETEIERSFSDNLLHF